MPPKGKPDLSSTYTLNQAAAQSGIPRQWLSGYLTRFDVSRTRGPRNSFLIDQDMLDEAKLVYTSGRLVARLHL